MLTEHPMLDNGLTPVAGKLWLVGPVVGSGKSMALETLEDSALFELVVSALGQGNVPAVIYDPRPNPAQIRYYPAGLKDVDNRKIFDIPTTERLDLQRILEVLNHTCERQLATPDAQSETGKLWADTDHHWVAAKAELIVQMYLVSALNGAFPTCIIRAEQSQVSGRLDIVVEEPDYAGNYVSHAVLELKVLRSFGSTGRRYTDNDMRAWIAKGVEQAYNYRIERGTLQSALCCFDMRTAHSGIPGFNEIAEEAGTLHVIIRWWRLFASSEAYRSHFAANAQSGQGNANPLLLIATELTSG